MEKLITITKPFSHLYNGKYTTLEVTVRYDAEYDVVDSIEKILLYDANYRYEANTLVTDRNRFLADISELVADYFPGMLDDIEGMDWGQFGNEAI